MTEDPNNHPAVIARNLQKLEESVNRLGERLDSLIAGFATKQYVDQIVDRMKQENSTTIELAKVECANMKEELESANKKIDKITEETKYYGLWQKAVLALCAIILVAVIKAILDLVIKQ